MRAAFRTRRGTAGRGRLADLSVHELVDLAEDLEREGAARLRLPRGQLLVGEALLFSVHMASGRYAAGA